MTTESHNPLDAALDLFVFVPVGLAITAAEELPKMAAKGRSRVTTQLTMARVVGQFAVAKGRSMIESRIDQTAPPAPPARQGPPAGGPDLSYEELLGRESTNGSHRPPLRSVPSPEDGVPNVGVTDADMPGGAPASAGLTGVGLPGADRRESNGALSASVAGDLDKAAASAAASAPSGAAERSGAAEGSGAAEARTNPSSLAIPGYDSLSASQVVQRLAGLSKDELSAVGAYEEAHRGRRTILNRVNQLQGQ